MLSGTACPWSPDFPPAPPFDLVRAAVRPTDVLDMALRVGRVKRPVGCEQTGLSRHRARREQALEGFVGRIIDDAVDPRWPEMALECGDDLLGGLVIGAGWREAVAKLIKLLLQPRDDLAVVARIELGAGHDIGWLDPQADAGFRKAPPGELFAGVWLACG